MTPFSLLVGLAPVVLLLVALILMDSYQLVTPRSVALSLGMGCAAAVVCFFCNRSLLETFHANESTLKWTFAPLIEEVAKAVWIVVLIRSNRVGFMVDAGIQGFAVGTGFALAENMYYAGVLDHAGPFVWLVRGLGTAVMHGSTTAIVAIVSKDLVDRRARGSWLSFLPGLGIAVVCHSIFNRLDRDSLLGTAVLLLIMPLVLWIVYERSERMTRDWLGTGLDTDVELLEQILGDEMPETRVGRYLLSLRQHFAGPVVGDMLSLLRVHLELSARARGFLIARAAGIELPPDPEVRANFEELKFLERAVGSTGRLALLPFLRKGGRELWQIHQLERRHG
jgi:protease PrsW